MTTKQAIHEIVDALSDAEAEYLLQYLKEETEGEYSEEFLARIEESRAEIRRGDFVTLDQLKAELRG